MTPPHRRQAERRTISLKEYEKQKKEVARKDQERERREEERKERYLARKAEDERRQREKEKRRAAEEEENTRNEEARRARKFREERRNEESFDHDKLDFDPEDDDENGLRQRALETQSRNLIPNYGSSDRRRYKIVLKLNICDTDTILFAEAQVKIPVNKPLQARSAESLLFLMKIQTVVKMTEM